MSSSCHCTYQLLRSHPRETGFSASILGNDPQLGAVSDHLKTLEDHHYLKHRRTVPNLIYSSSIASLRMSMASTSSSLGCHSPTGGESSLKTCGHPIAAMLRESSMISKSFGEGDHLDLILQGFAEDHVGSDESCGRG